MDDCIQVGLVATNYQQNSTVTATFANVSYSDGSSNALGSIEQRAESIEAPYALDVFPNPTSGELVRSASFYDISSKISLLQQR